jgi:hypothetical protein
MEITIPTLKNRKDHDWKECIHSGSNRYHCAGSNGPRLSITFHDNIDPRDNNRGSLAVNPSK